MRKVLTMMVVLFMVLSLSGIALAEETTVSSTGQQDVLVSYTSNVPEAFFTVMIPATLATGEEKTISATATLGKSQILSVTTSSTVKLYFDGDENADYAVVPVSYTPISLSVENYGDEGSASSLVTVDPANSLAQVMGFGTWKGTLVFDISMTTDNTQSARDVMSYVEQAGLEAAITAGIKEFTISGGEWNTGWENTIIFTSGSTLTIAGGEFSGEVFYTNHADVIIEDGTFNSILWISDGSLTITGGTFNIGANCINVDSIDSGKSFTISGGTFIVNPEEVFKSNGVKIAEGYHVHNNGDETWTVVPDDAS